LWCHSPAVLIVQVPGKKFSLVLSPAPPIDDNNVLRSSIVLEFLQEVTMLGKPDADNMIDAALDALAAGDREASARLARKALDRFPELENSPDVSLLHLFSRLGFPETEASATAVIKAHPSLPTAWFYYGQYVENRKRYREAAACYDKIVLHQPPWHNWTVEAARKELNYLRTN
jgi:tetratricopeptide (TPR) repeat protein